ncbi:MAG: hypothetical protein LBU27_00645 [Candidatus Peribacteria bacterium]|nr:hypothetical protein [Candidatus Peribacteria bacterium]
MIVKICTVPASSRNFEGKGTVVKSIEEIFGQLIGVVDTLDKSGELGTYKKEKEMLDNSASNINFGKSITFTFDQVVQKKADPQKKPKQLKEKELNDANITLLESLGIANPLENPTSVNTYILTQDSATIKVANTMMAIVNYDAELQKQTVLEENPKLLEDTKTTANREKDINLETMMATFLSQHRTFWIDATSTIKEFTTFSSVLLGKKGTCP